LNALMVGDVAAYL